jgi:hypothetical protein
MRYDSSSVMLDLVSLVKPSSSHERLIVAESRRGGPDVVEGRPTETNLRDLKSRNMFMVSEQEMRDCSDLP